MNEEMLFNVVYRIDIRQNKFILLAEYRNFKMNLFNNRKILRKFKLQKNNKNFVL